MKLSIKLKAFPAFITSILCLLLTSCADKGEVDNDSVLYNYVVEGKLNEVRQEDFLNHQGKKTDLASTIARCADPVYESDICTLSELNFIGYNNELPSKSDIMQRVIVSNPWMAARFEQALDGMPEDMYRLFSSVTAVVIHANIRPAYFWPTTGAIYLDPQYLWQSQAEYETISKEEDYRADNGNAFNFITLSRYSKNGEFAWSYQERNSQDVLYALSALLFHELAHARDQFPLTEIKSTSLDSTPYSLANNTQTTTQALHQSYPLINTTIKSLAQVLFTEGTPPSQSQLTLTASDLSHHFYQDGANDLYNFLEYEDGHYYEDTAMLFEEAMMKLHYDIDREFSFATPLNSVINSCGDIALVGSVVNRIFDASVQPRVELVVNQLLPNHKHSSFFETPPKRGTYRYCVSPQGRALDGKLSPMHNLKLAPAMDWH